MSIHWDLKGNLDIPIKEIGMAVEGGNNVFIQHSISAVSKTEEISTGQS